MCSTSSSNRRNRRLPDPTVFGCTPSDLVTVIGEVKHRTVVLDGMGKPPDAGGTFRGVRYIPYEGSKNPPDGRAFYQAEKQ